MLTWLDQVRRSRCSSARLSCYAACEGDRASMLYVFLLIPVYNSNVYLKKILTHIKSS